MTWQINGKPRCPLCKEVLDGWRANHDSLEPEAGDLTLCGYCMGVLKFVGNAPNLTYEVATQDDMDQLDPAVHSYWKRFTEFMASK